MLGWWPVWGETLPEPRNPIWGRPANCHRWKGAGGQLKCAEIMAFCNCFRAGITAGLGVILPGCRALFPQVLGSGIGQFLGSGTERLSWGARGGAQAVPVLGCPRCHLGLAAGLVFRAPDGLGMGLRWGQGQQEPPRTPPPSPCYHRHAAPGANTVLERFWPHFFALPFWDIWCPCPQMPSQARPAGLSPPIPTAQGTGTPPRGLFAAVPCPSPWG